MTAIQPWGSAGFTLVETLIALVISALIVTLVLPMTSEGARRNAALADREMFMAEQARAEAAFGALLGDALLRAPGPADPKPAAARGSRKSLVVQIEGGSFPPCGEPVRRGAARFFVQDIGRGGRLACDLGGRPTELLRWQEGEGAFDYSADGTRWQGAWPAPETRTPPRPIDMRVAAALPDPVLVRFTIRRGDRALVLWIGRAGDPSSTGQPL